MGAPMRAALVLESGQLVEAHDPAQRRQVAARPRELLVLGVVLDEGEHGLGVGEDVGALLRRVRRVEPGDDCADRHRRPVEKHPFEPRAREHRHDVAAAHAAREQRVREHLDPLARLPPGDVAPAVVALFEVGGGAGAQREHVPEHVRGGAPDGAGARFGRGRG